MLNGAAAPTTPWSARTRRTPGCWPSRAGTRDSQQLARVRRFGSVIGGQGIDRFVVPDGRTFRSSCRVDQTGSMGSNNTLDLSAYTSPLTEHIMTSVYGGNVTTLNGGNIISVVRAFAGCHNVIGGQSDDHFIFNQGYG